MKALLFLLLIIPVPLPTPDQGVHVLAFLSPDNSFPTISSLIENATHTIYLAVYSFSNPRLLDELNEALHRGVQVYVLLEDHHVSHFEDKYTLYAAYNLTKAGAHVRRAPHDYRYMHAKYLIVDNSTVMVFTGNFAKTSVPYDPSYGNRERGVIIYDVNVATFYASVFLQDFSRGEPYDESQGTGESVSYHVEHGSYPHPFGTLETNVERIIPFVLPNSSVVNEYVRLILTATESVEVEIAYAELRRDSIDDTSPLIQALIQAASKGVNVRVIIGFYSDLQASVVQYLRDHGVRVARGPTETNAENVPVEPIFAAIHTKTMIIDGRIVVVSSANRSDNAFNNNREAGVIIYSEDLAEYFHQAFQRDREHSLVLPPIASHDYLSVTIISPSNGSVVNDPMNLIVDVNASDSGELAIYVDDNEILVRNFTLGYHRFNFTIDLNAGDHVILVKAVSGNLVAKSVVYVSVEGEETHEGGEEKENETPMRLTYLVIAIIVLAGVIKRLKKKRVFT